MSQQRILIVEDERDMAELLAMRLKRELYEVDVAYDGVRALEKIRASRPDLVLLDVMLPKKSGTEALKEIRSDPATADVPVVLLTARTEEGDIVAGLHIGADDYVTKPFSMSVLIARIAAVLRRAEAAGEGDRSTISVGPIEVNQDTHHVAVGGGEVSLTLTEFKLLVAILAARGRVLSRSQLIDRAIGVDAVVTDRTIDVHLAGLRRKLGDARKYIQTVRGVGYRLAVGDDETT